MGNIYRRTFVGAASAAAVIGATKVSRAGKKYDDGASDTEIKLGHTCPYSGPASAYGVNGKAIVAYWDMINDTGGINGRKIKFITLDDGYSPPKTVECIRQLVEQEKVLCTHNTLGTATNTAIHKYMNQKKVPQLYVATGASKWGDPARFPWTMGFQPDYHTEGSIYAKHVLATVTDPRIGVLMQNDDYGKDYWEGFREGLGKEAGRVVKHVTYEINEPTVDSQIIQLKAADANVFFNIATPKFAAQAMRKVADLNWKPVQYVNNVAASVGTVMKPAGFDNVQGIITAAYLMDPTDPNWADHPDMKAFKAWMAKYHPTAHLADLGNVNGYTVSYLMAETLRRCGDELTRVNVMKQATSFQKFRVPMLLPGITVSTSPSDYFPIQAVQLQRFKGQSWELFGDVLDAEST
ncbi:amino acid/amide ABC transporter substrate-binding protein, HAAT family (TC 3.A.1.4.-) [Enhydrobacter aerosaccus]|uniref:Amino acid/amide ABC transporter substrate-binding protein, HAAT family (TC 3.A.1.4.-) n=1 Tax=Enhydrobacter aerosaccus TaxID=225324 RepID=A0A1T4L9I3_9HYPH|nr:ABC transporter substrate-binding protein [Enhydrobacter aerosaccus]SJZ51260.1 amino acid/amide ABC transporter substrate-binding protein, HAAT family (TC 3.A.1.4.-) [Enhydrobacter aerosaccus]